MEQCRGCLRTVPVDLTPVTDLHDSHDEHIVPYLVEHPVGADANPVARTAAERQTAMRPGVVGQIDQELFHTSPRLYGQLAELTERQGTYLDLVGHAGKSGSE